jgi:FkbM family methyltransferase
LRENRNCIIETDCVWKKSNEKLLFIENGVLSTLNEFKDSDMHTRNSQTEYSVNTISLNDLLEKNNSPKVIDYLSIDTEGSEFEILNSFDFSKYEIKIITVEHNYTQSREKIFNLLSINGYNRVLTDVSAYDDWYLLENYEK